MDDFDRVAGWALANIAALVEEAGVELRGGRGRCPFHGGEDRNFAVTPSRGWYCHSQCAEGGDGIDFLRRIRWPGLPEREGRVEAIRALAPRAGVTLGKPGTDSTLRRIRRPTLPPEPRERPDPTPTAPAAEVSLEGLRADGYTPATPADIYRALLEMLDPTGAGRAFMASRGFDPDVARAYGFRSVVDWAALADELRDSFLTVELEIAGLDHLPARGWAWGEREPALVIPYRSGPDVVALRVRSLAAEAKGGRYRDLPHNPPPLPFNADALAGTGDLHIVEGELNAFALAVNGVRAIGLPGAGRSRSEWTGLVRDAVGEGLLVAWYDADEAGTRGRRKLTGELQAAYGRAWVTRHGRTVLLEGEDANDLHEQGRLHAEIQRAAWR